MKNAYAPVCRSTAGISDVPDGREYYGYLARFWTTTDMTPDEIFETGQKEVTRLRAEMERVKNETGFKGDLKSFFNYLHTDKKFMPYKEPAEVINAYKNIEARMQPQLKKLFNLVPKAKFEVRQTEKFREASASAEYNQSAPDGSRPGIFYVPVPDATKFNVVGMEDLFLHEAFRVITTRFLFNRKMSSFPGSGGLAGMAPMAKAGRCTQNRSEKSLDFTQTPINISAALTRKCIVPFVWLLMWACI
jgi:uncharacterized protein (DUF885 family)